MEATLAWVSIASTLETCFIDIEKCLSRMQKQPVCAPQPRASSLILAFDTSWCLRLVIRAQNTKRRFSLPCFQPHMFYLLLIWWPDFQQHDNDICIKMMMARWWQVLRAAISGKTIYRVRALGRLTHFISFSHRSPAAIARAPRWCYFCFAWLIYNSGWEAEYKIFPL